MEELMDINNEHYLLKVRTFTDNRSFSPTHIPSSIFHDL